ncbi:MAG TPA: hypothetical protein VLM05_02185 [Mycobacteriales bacterium]|nr:hypothetical protein [Mycobacteriales bacterium]
MGQINGLPAHVLIVHFVVVAVPLSALLLVASALWPAARRRLGPTTPVLALVTLLSVPVATNAGEWLQRRVPADPLVREHVRLGDALLPWAIGLVVVSAAVWAVDRYAARVREPVGVGAVGVGAAGPRPADAPPMTGPAVRIVLAVLAVVVAAGSVVQVYRIGESGARAAWHTAVQQTPTGGDD